MHRIFVASALAAGAMQPALAQTGIDAMADAVEPKVIAWRRHIHQNPELGYQEAKTAAYVAEALRAMPGIEVQTGIARTGIKAALRGGKPGPVVALRADMDALPVEERNELPFRSQAKAMWQGRETFVMHACGHDAHVAMLLGAAEILSQMRAEIPGTVVFFSQPAEDFGAFSQRAPGFFWFLNAPPQDERSGAPNHSPLFMIGEKHMKTGVKALVNVALEYLRAPRQ